MNRSTCGKCGGPTEFGILIDEVHGHREGVLEWVRGLPKRSWVTGRFVSRGRDRLQIATVRCTQCGFVEIYAPDPDQNLCRKCSYDRRGLAIGAPCPECGTKP